MNPRRTQKLILSLIFFAVWSCPGQSQAPAGEVADRIVAIVNDDCITLSELDAAAQPYLRRLRTEQYRPDRLREMRFKLRQQVLNTMIDQKLAEQEAKRLNVWVEEEEVNEYIERTKEQHAMTEEDLRKALAAEGLSLEQYRNQAKEQLLQRKLINIEVRSKIAVTEDEIKDYYEEHKGDYGGEKKYHLRSIFIAFPDSAGEEEKKAALEKAESIKQSIAAGGPDSFGELAKRFSDDDSAASGGDLGEFNLDELSERIRELLRDLKEGDITPVLERPHGYQILMVEGIEEGKGKGLEEVRADIQEKLYRASVEGKYKTWLKELRERSFVRIMQ